MTRRVNNQSLYGGAYRPADANRDRDNGIDRRVIGARLGFGHGPVDRSPAHLKRAVDDAATAFNADPTAATWAALSTAVQAALDHDDAQRRMVA